MKTDFKNWSQLITLTPAFLYALIKGPAPSLMPPKYLTTTIILLFKLFASSKLYKGSPAVPEGSLSSVLPAVFPNL